MVRVARGRGLRRSLSSPAPPTSSRVRQPGPCWNPGGGLYRLFVETSRALVLAWLFNVTLFLGALWTFVAYTSRYGVQARAHTP